MADTFRFVAPIKRRNHGRGHSYRDANGRKVPGVTTVLKAYPKPALIGWASRIAAECVVDEWDKLDEMKPSARYDYVRGAPNRIKNEKAARGTVLHRLAVKLAKDEEVEIPDGQYELVESYISFLDRFRVRPILLEFAVVSHLHGYAGTGDLIAELWNPEINDWEIWLIDIKTSAGVYADNALQLAAYRWADHWVDPEGEYHPLPKIQRSGILHVRQDNFDLIPLETDRPTFDYFLNVRRLYDFVEEEGQELIGEPLEHPELPEEDRGLISVR